MWIYIKILSPAEQNYQIYNKELLRVIRGLKTWKHLLQGSSHRTKIMTDHMNLLHYNQPQNLNQRQAQWQLCLSQCNYTIQHDKRSRMQIPDALSQRSNYMEGTDRGNKDVVLIPDNLII